jgi:hypothetical protein
MKKKMSNKEISTIGWLSPERSVAFETKLAESFKNYRYFDFKILPKLQPSKIDNGEDAFKWIIDWKCEVGMPNDAVLKEDDLTALQRSTIDDFAQELGWHLVQNTKKAMPVSWDGASFSISAYNKHPSWKYVENNDNLQGFNYTYSHGIRCARKFVGVMQVKDADLSVTAAIKNCLDLVDWLIILENNSSDNTMAEIEKIRETSNKILVKNILTIGSGGRYLNSLCGTDSIVIKIDADEFCDPQYTNDIRNTLLNVDLSNLVFPSKEVLDVNGIDLIQGICVGKIRLDPYYYFGNIMAWHQSKERLHGQNIFLRKGCTNKKVKIFKQTDPVMLHFPFLDMCSLRREDYSPGDEQQKRRYVETNPERWNICMLENFNINKMLEEVLRGEKIWSLGDTHPHLV